jgi:hypothetical protein
LKKREKMGLPPFTKRLVEKKLQDYCAQKVPEHARNQLRVGFKIRGNSVTLFEERPAFPDPSQWVDIVVAQFRYNPSCREWTLYCADRNSRWHEYDDLEANKDFDVLLREVEEDPTGIFWG